MTLTAVWRAHAIRVRVAFLEVLNTETIYSPEQFPLALHFGLLALELQATDVARGIGTSDANISRWKGGQSIPAKTTRRHAIGWLRQKGEQQLRELAQTRGEPAKLPTSMEELRKLQKRSRVRCRTVRHHANETLAESEYLLRVSSSPQHVDREATVSARDDR